MNTENPKFKPGDRVRSTLRSNTNSFFPPGVVIRTIAAITKPGGLLEIQFDDGRRAQVRARHACLVEQTPAPAQPPVEDELARREQIHKDIRTKLAGYSPELDRWAKRLGNYGEGIDGQGVPNYLHRLGDRLEALALEDDAIHVKQIAHLLGELYARCNDAMRYPLARVLGLDPRPSIVVEQHPDIPEAE